MLNRVPEQIRRSARLVALRHPNSISCTLYYKQLNRTPDGNPPEFGGIPTIGGVGVMDSEDEADFDYVAGPPCKAVFTGQYMGDLGNIRDNDASSIYRDMPVEAIIECVLESTDPEYRNPDKNDLIIMDYGSGVVMTYEVIGPTSTVEIPPYTRKYALAPRQDTDNGM